MKYEDEFVAAAIYSDQSENFENPLMEAMPPMLSKDKVFEKLKSIPQVGNLDGLPTEKRLTRLTALSTYFQPLDYMYMIYNSLYRAIKTTYSNFKMVESARQICAIRNKSSIICATQPENGSILGVPGIGKTSTVRRCLNLMPQVIEHDIYRGEMFFCKQILWLCVECPSDCSVKTLAYSIVNAIDNAVGSSNLERVRSLQRLSVSALAMQTKIACINNHIGLIVIDEIQNVVTTSSLRGQTKPLIRFLLELTNEASTAVWMVGTPVAEDVFRAEDHLKRRTRGMRLVPMKADGVYRKFIEELWKCQYTQKNAILTDEIANLLYDRSGGVPSYLVQLFRESQAQAILSNYACINRKIINDTAKLLAFSVPRHYGVGTSISEINLDSTSLWDEEPTIQKRQYAKKRGRKPQSRESNDLLVLAAQEIPLLDEMLRLGMVEYR